MKPTRRALWLVAAGLPLSLLPALVAARLWPLGVAFLAAAALALAVGLLLLPGRAAWSAEAAVPATLELGEPGWIEVSLRVDRPALVHRVELWIEADEVLERPPRQEIALDEQGAARVRVEIRAHRRGLFPVHALALRCAGPLRLVERAFEIELRREVAVVSNLRAVRQAALRLSRSSASFAGRKPERYVGDGSEFDSLRDFEPGFDARAIDWKASARHRRILCREMRAERNHQLVLAIDCGQRMREPIDGITRLDRAIQAALVLSWVGLKHGDRVGLFAFAAKPIEFQPPASGMAAFPRLKRATAALEASPDASNYTLALAHLAQRLPRRALVVLFTDFADSIGAELLVENAGRLARRHVVLFAALRDPELDSIALAPPRDASALHRAVVAEELLQDRAEVLERVARLGVRVIDARAQDVDSRLVNAYLEAKRRELVA